METNETKHYARSSRTLIEENSNSKDKTVDVHSNTVETCNVSTSFQFVLTYLFKREYICKEVLYQVRWHMYDDDDGT